LGGRSIESRTHPGEEQLEHLQCWCRHRERQVQRGGDADQRLPEILLARAHAFRILVHHLAVVIHPAHCAEAQRDDQHRPDQTVRQVTPQQRGHSDDDQNQHAAHGRGAVFFQVGLRTIGTHSLAVFHGGQLADHGPAARPMNSAVAVANTARKVMKLKTRRADVLLEKLCEPEQHD
jgi:hypothetical protein